MRKNFDKKDIKPFNKGTWFKSLIVIYALGLIFNLATGDNEENTKQQYSKEIENNAVSSLALKNEVNSNFNTNTLNKEEAINDVIYEDVDYIELWSYYSDEDYKDKNIRIIGKASYVSDECVTIDEGLSGFTSSIQADFKNNQNDLQNIKAGEYITIVGQCKQKSIGCVYIENCYLEEISSNRPAQLDVYESIRKDNEIKREEEYKANVGVVSYDELLRNPDKYTGKSIYVDLTVSQLMIGGVLKESGYRGKENGQEWYVHYELDDGESRILEGDKVRFYGEFTGLAQMTRALTNTKVLIPRLEAVYRD